MDDDVKAMRDRLGEDVMGKLYILLDGGCTPGNIAYRMLHSGYRNHLGRPYEAEDVRLILGIKS